MLCYLTGVVSIRATGTEAAGRQDEKLLRHRVDLSRAFLIPDDRDRR